MFTLRPQPFFGKRAQSTWSILVSNSPLIRNNGDPPPLDLIQLGVGDFDLQREAGHPHRHLQWGTQMLVCEMNNDIHFAFHLLPVDKDIVTSIRDLEKREVGGKMSKSHHKHLTTMP